MVVSQCISGITWSIVAALVLNVSLLDAKEESQRRDIFGTQYEEGQHQQTNSR